MALQPRHRLALTLAATIASITPALADRIDGEWCNGVASLQIEGPSIRTPGGNQITGDYSRHGFAYAVPANEPEAGTQIVMHLVSEEQMTLTKKDKPDETWRRCKVTS